MIDPFIDITKVKDGDLENKIQELNKKYFMTNNADLRFQIIRFLDIYKTELHARRVKIYQEQFEKSGEKGLDNLIKTN